MPDVLKEIIWKIPSPRVITLIGAGGKTTLMYYLVNRLQSEGISAVATTTTRLNNNPPPHGRLIRIRSLGEGLARGCELSASLEKVTIVQGEDEGNPNKLVGIPAEWIDSLAATYPETVWIVEGDGAAGRSLKGHQNHEPVIPRTAGLVITVIGVDGINRPLDSNYVHRPERVSELLGISQGVPMTEANIAKLLFHPQGYLRCCPPKSIIVPYINKVESPGEEKSARRLAKLILAERRPNLPGVILGSLREEKFCLVRRNISGAGGMIWYQP